MTAPRFKDGLRVHVNQTADGIALHAEGTVRRMRSDGGAWIELDERSKVEKAHPFPADDAGRGRHVLAYPDDCRLPTATGKQRRRAARAAKAPSISLATFGKDHWSTFAYIECCCTDRGGEIQREKMRCDPKRHPVHAHLASVYLGPCPPTRLHDGTMVSDHDDWDCVDELEAEGLIENIRTTAQPLFRMTEEGRRCAAAIRAHKQDGGSFSTFTFVRPEARRA